MPYGYYVAYYEKSSTSTVATNLYEATDTEAKNIGVVLLNNIYGLGLNAGQIKVASVAGLEEDNPTTT